MEPLVERLKELFDGRSEDVVAAYVFGSGEVARS
jgi:hypothetical protein